MSIINTIEETLHNYKFLNGKYPSSIQVTEAGKKELTKVLTEQGFESSLTDYEPEDTEFGRFRDIKVYVERPNEIRIS